MSPFSISSYSRDLERSPHKRRRQGATWRPYKKKALLPAGGEVAAFAEDLELLPLAA